MTPTEQAARLTAEQFFAMPDDGKRYELIEGELYPLTIPTLQHRRITRRLFLRLNAEATRVGGEAFFSGIGVVVGEDIVLEPDIAVVLRPVAQADVDRGLEAPPDLVVEVLSASTADRDRSFKADQYARRGVREYWLVSPEVQTIGILVLRDGEWVLHARPGRDEPVTSTVLPGLTVPASAAFHDQVPRACMRLSGCLSAADRSL